jgi:bacteriorhodopsin
MGLSSLWFYWMAARVPVVSLPVLELAQQDPSHVLTGLQQTRIFHILTSIITTFAFLSYFALATGDGINLHAWRKTETKQHIVTELYLREVYWARYIDWALTTPLLLIDLALFAGLSGANILIMVVADVIMVLTGLFAAFGKNDGQKWGWYTIACIAFLVVVWQLGYNGRRALVNRDKKTQKFFASISLFVLLVWTAYPM